MLMHFLCSILHLHSLGNPCEAFKKTKPHGLGADFNSTHFQSAVSEALSGTILISDYDTLK